jgi:hypothetical protein
MSRADLEEKAQESKRETKEERKARRKKEIHEANAQRFAAFEAQSEQKPLADAAVTESPVIAVESAAEVTSPDPEVIGSAAPIDIYQGLTQEEIKKREIAVVKIQSRARGVAIRSSDVKEKAAQRKQAAEMARLEFQRRQLAEVNTMSAMELGRTSEDIRIEEKLSAAEQNLHSQAHS